MKRRIEILSWICLVVVVTALMSSGCGTDETPWWNKVTGVPGSSLGFDDLWEADYPPGKNITFQARIRDGNLGRLDFSRNAGGYGVIFNNNRTVRVNAETEEVPVDRTIFLLYMLPFLGHERLGEILTGIGIDTALVVTDVQWEGRACFIVGDSLHLEEPVREDAKSLAIGGQTDRKPAIYFDAETGAVLRLITVDTTPIGLRLGDFRTYDHQLRGGAWLPTRFETYARGAGLRSRVRQSTQADGRNHAKNVYTIPDKIE